MNVSAVYFFGNVFFAILNAYYALHGAFPRFSALTFGICTAAAVITGYDWIHNG